MDFTCKSPRKSQKLMSWMGKSCQNLCYDVFYFGKINICGEKNTTRCMQCFTLLRQGKCVSIDGTLVIEYLSMAASLFFVRVFKVKALVRVPVYSKMDQPIVCKSSVRLLLFMLTCVCVLLWPDGTKPSRDRVQTTEEYQTSPRKIASRFVWA